MSDEAVPEPVDELQNVMVVASNHQQMQVAQQQLIVWVDQKLTILRAEMHNAELSLESARKHKWKISGYQAQVRKCLHRIEFYEKLRCAVEMGYTIIPNFENVDVFAIRTERRPRRNFASQDAIYGTVIPHDQTSESPPLGEGEYVNATAHYEQRKLQHGTDDKGKPEYLQQAWATKHDVVDFPFKLVRPEILDSTEKAMKLLCFDDLSVLPERHRARRGDPMVIGRIHLAGGGKVWKRKTLSFLITWFIDTKTL